MAVPVAKLVRQRGFVLENVEGELPWAITHVDYRGWIAHCRSRSTALEYAMIFLAEDIVNALLRIGRA
jgi:hypothetical protein